MTADRIVTIPADEVAVGDTIWVEGGWRRVDAKAFGWTPPDYGAEAVAGPEHMDSTRTIVISFDPARRHLVLPPERMVRLNLARLHRSDVR